MKPIFPSFLHRSKSLAALAALLLAALAARGADVTIFGIEKGETFLQNSPSAPAPESGTPFFFRAFVNGAAPGLVQFAFLQPPSGFNLLTADSSGRNFTFEQRFASQSALDSAFAIGDYTFTIQSENDGSSAPTLSLANGALPSGAPHISNFAAAQFVNPAAPFAVTWDNLPSGGAGDFVQLTIEGGNGDAIFSTPAQGEPGALTGSSTSATIPAGTLASGSSYNGRLLFQKIASDDPVAYPGADGITSFATETVFSVLTSGTSVDTTPPFLVSTSPAANATKVPIDAVVSFTFNEAMGTGSAINWSANITPAKFTCTWSGDKRTFNCAYAGGLPKNAVISWTLNPSGAGPSQFADAAGNPLPANVFSGHFTTSNQTNNPCETNIPPATAGYSVSKSLSYDQTSGADPVLATDGASFIASVTPPSNKTLSGVTLRLPDGSTATLSNFFGSSFFAFESFPSRAAMEAKFGSGTYRFTINEQGGATHVSNLNLPSSSFPSTPHISNWTAGQSINPDANFTLHWDAFDGATAQDGISLTISDGTDVVFRAPDPCIPRDLKATDTSIVIPAGTLSAGKVYQTSLSFFRVTDRDSTTWSGVPGSASLSKMTTLSLRTTGQGPTPQPPRFATPIVQPSGAVHLHLDGEAGVIYRIEVSSDLINWIPLTSTTGGASFDFDDFGAIGAMRRFYRASSP